MCARARLAIQRSIPSSSAIRSTRRHSSDAPHRASSLPMRIIAQSLNPSSSPAPTFRHDRRRRSNRDAAAAQPRCIVAVIRLRSGRIPTEIRPLPNQDPAMASKDGERRWSTMHSQLLCILNYCALARALRYIYIYIPISIVIQ